MVESTRRRGALDGVSSAGKPRALVVEDAPEFRELVADRLRAEGFETREAGDGETGLELAQDHAPDLVVLDLGLPTIDGIEVCRRLRAFSDAYVIMLTGRDDEVDKLVGLSVGADDYMTKPFSPRELIARVQAMLRRPRRDATSSERRIGDLTIDVNAREVRRDGALVELTRIEFDLIEALSRRPKVVLSRGQLLERVWGPDWFGDDHVVDVHMSSLRQKIGDDPRSPRYIRTIRGVGYRIAEAG